MWIKALVASGRILSCTFSPTVSIRFHLIAVLGSLFFFFFDLADGLTLVKKSTQRQTFAD
jgi:hypothetical protein